MVGIERTHVATAAALLALALAGCGVPPVNDTACQSCKAGLEHAGGHNLTVTQSTLWINVTEDLDSRWTVQAQLKGGVAEAMRKDSVIADTIGSSAVNLHKLRDVHPVHDYAVSNVSARMVDDRTVEITFRTEDVADRHLGSVVLVDLFNTLSGPSRLTGPDSTRWSTGADQVYLTVPPGHRLVGMPHRATQVDDRTLVWRGSEIPNWGFARAVPTDRIVLPWQPSLAVLLVRFESVWPTVLYALPGVGMAALILGAKGTRTDGVTLTLDELPDRSTRRAAGVALATVVAGVVLAALFPSPALLGLVTAVGFYVAIVAYWEWQSLLPETRIAAGVVLTGWPLVFSVAVALDVGQRTPALHWRLLCSLVLAVSAGFLTVKARRVR